ncbi:PCDGE protein, partial [Grantiella picta]|nr:PCDGE protein [Grantiella picta]
IGELIPPGTRFPLEIARDEDVGSNSLLTYQLTSNPSFSLSMKEKPGGKKQPELVLERTLDREKQSLFQLILTAVDGGDPARSGTVQVRVNVTDANDNPPMFSKSNLPVGSLVLRVQATDADTGSNGRVSYSFGSVPDAVRELFAIDSESGEVRTLSPLDFEEKNKYIFSLEATDGGGLTDHSEVQIHIIDENDNAPEITILSLSSPLKMSEMTALGSLFLLPEAHDPDTGRNSLQSYELSGDEHFSLAVQSGPGGDQRPELVLAKALDREEAAFHELVLRASDGGDPALTGTARIRVTVLDANDNAPVFSQSEYTVRVPEDVPVNSTLVTATATDADEGQNGHVKYS